MKHRVLVGHDQDGLREVRMVTCTDPVRGDKCTLLPGFHEPFLQKKGLLSIPCLLWLCFTLNQFGYTTGAI